MVSETRETADPSHHPRKRGRRIPGRLALGGMVYGAGMLTGVALEKPIKHAETAARNAAASMAIAVADRITPPICNPEEAVDLYLRRMLLTRIQERLAEEKRMPSALPARAAVIEVEIQALQQHPLYQIIKPVLASHLRRQGYDEISLERNTDGTFRLPNNAWETIIRCEGATNLLIPFLAGPEPLFPFLPERSMGPTVAKRQDGYVVPMDYAIQMLGRNPEEMRAIAPGVQVIPRDSESLIKELDGGSLHVPNSRRSDCGGSSVRRGAQASGPTDFDE
jgi:hypothetical protein